MGKQRTCNRNFACNAYDAPLGHEYYEAILVLYARESLQQMIEKEAAGMGGHTALTILIFMLLLMVIVLVWLVDMVSLYSDRLAKLQEENKRLRQMIHEGFLLDDDGMAEL